jgi:FtsP/CotA-like multicopper oxidase with cupredoxin domain
MHTKRSESSRFLPAGFRLPKKRTVVALTAAIAALSAGGIAVTQSMPANDKDESKVPHYFGPNPNWANSPFRLPDVAVELTNGGGSGATAAAEVDPVSGAITSIKVTNPGSGYTSAPNVVITSKTGSSASATAIVDYSGTVGAITVDNAGAGYTTPKATISGGGATIDATATVYGGVDAVQVTDGGHGYTMPTVEFGLPQSPTGIQATGHVPMIANGDAIDGMDANGTITAVVVDNPGSGYAHAPSVTIHNGTTLDPISGATLASAGTTIKVSEVVVDSFGSGYTAAPTVTITDTAGTGSGALATATINTSGGAVTGITVTSPGQDYMTPGIKKFTDNLPGICYPGGALASKGIPDCPTSGKYIPLGVAEEKTYNGVASDEYVIGLVQYRTSFSSSLPDTLVRGYVQIETPGNASVSQHVALYNEMMDGSKVRVKINGQDAYAVTPPQWLGPTIAATKNKPVRVVFHNLLPTGAGGDLFLPTDSGLMGAGTGPAPLLPGYDSGSVLDEVRNPSCTDNPQLVDPMTGGTCFKQNRATLHLHGGLSPWISDGTPHQWITPANEDTPWPEGVSVKNVPDMHTNPDDPTSPVLCDAKNDGCQTFYYTNQQSARLMFYHDHSWGTTRLNVYAGEAAGYLISDDAETLLVDSGTIPGPDATIPLIVQDRTFVPEDSQMFNQKDANGNVVSYGQDPTWDKSRWGAFGSLWYHHVYMPAQNPGDPSGMSAYGRWMYGAWFWPPASNLTYGPIDNPYYDPNCNLDIPSTWQYQVAPFCEPLQIPGTPNVSVGMEQFNDTPVVNGVAYPTVTLEPKAYRLRVLNAANDRFFNFQWYVADPTTGTDSEVALKAAELAAAQDDPVVFPTPDTSISLPGPDWIQIGTEGGWLPAPVVIDGQQVTTWITDPTRFDVGNVDQHSLLLAPAERADVIVDFSKFAGKTLILYNDAPAAFPARIASYDYYTGAPDLSPVGAPKIVPGYGPNTRTVMRVKIADSTPAAEFDLAKLENAFKSTSKGGLGIFESAQPPIIVGQAAYNSAYGSNFAASGNCNTTGGTSSQCDGLVRINDTQTVSFNTLLAPNSKTTLPSQPKAIHDEMNSTSFDPFGRMQAFLGMEAPTPTPGLQNVTLYPYINPTTDLIDGTNLPQAMTFVDSGAGAKMPVELQVAPISTAADGTQIWRFTHNGVDTHPIHFHLYDVQVLNRVTWDNIIIPPDANELGWKDTVRISPLEDTIVALRPITPGLPFELPNSIRPLNPMMPIGDTTLFNNILPDGTPTTTPISNELVNFGWEYVYHCHILSHEEMDMMRPQSLVMPPKMPGNLGSTFSGSGNRKSINLSWMDNSILETAYVVQRSADGVNWTDVKTVNSPLDRVNTVGPKSSGNLTVGSTPYLFRIVAQNQAGYGSGFPTLTATSVTGTLGVNLPAAPMQTDQPTALLQVGPQISLTFKDNASTETGFIVQRLTDNVGDWVEIARLPARTNTGSVTYVDATVQPGHTYAYRVAAYNLGGVSAWRTAVPGIIVPNDAKPTVPYNLQAANLANTGNTRNVLLRWTDKSTNETKFEVQRATNAAFTANLVATDVAATTGTGTVKSLTVSGLARNTSYYFRVRAVNGNSASAWLNALPLPIRTNR